MDISKDIWIGAVQKEVDSRVANLDENGNLTAQVFGERISYSASGAVALTSTMVSLSASAGALAMTLSSGTAGQILYIKAINVSINDAVLTPSSFFDGTSITFSGVGIYSAILAYNGSSWEVMFTDGTVA